MEQKRLGDIATYINGYAFKPAAQLGKERVSRQGACGSCGSHGH